MTRYRAKRGQTVPMPDRPGQFVPDSGEGTAVNETSPYYARMIADGDLVAVEDEQTEQATQAAPAKTEGKK